MFIVSLFLSDEERLYQRTLSWLQGEFHTSWINVSTEQIGV